MLERIQVPKPRPGAGEVLVRVHAAGVNALDWKTRAYGLFLGRPPFTLGWDVSGVVEAVGTGVTLLEAGDEIFGMPRLPHQAGAYAEFVAAPARHFTRRPAGLSHVAAAALPLCSLTAWQALVETADVRAGQRVLIHGAGGGFGHLAVQVAKSLDAYVLGTASSSKHDLLHKLGADELIDYNREDFTRTIAAADVVIDAVGGDYGARSLTVLRPGGVLVTLPQPEPDHIVAAAAKRGIRAVFLLVEPDHAGMEAIAALAASGKLRAEVGIALPLAEAARAHTIGEAGHTTGKIVLSVPA